VRQRNSRARISDDMEQLIARCLEKSPEDRFAPCNDLLEALREVARVQLTPEGQTWTGAYEPDARQHAAKAWLEDTAETPWWEQISSERLVGVSNEFAEETLSDSGPFGVDTGQSDQRSAPRLAIGGRSPLDQRKTAEVAASAFSALLVDDDRALAEELVEILGLHDCSMRVADGASALEAARQRRPSVILVSVELAGASGYTLCSQLKKDPALCRVPVVLMCNDAKDEVFELHQTLPVRADRYLAKPLRHEELTDVLKSVLLTPPAGQPESAARSGSPREDPPELVVLDAKLEERARRSHMGLLLVGLALLLSTLSIAVYLTITL
jgi:CheY-like chemotaxis protein